MLLKQCEKCQYCARLIALGLGVRCTNPENNPKDNDGKLPILISAIVECDFFVKNLNNGVK